MTAFDLLHNPVAIGLVAGLLAAARIDYEAFKSWQSFHDVATYDWKTASWRWLRGAIVGAVAGLGFDSLT